MPTCVVSDSLLIFDHISRRIKILVNAHIQDDAESAYDQAVKTIAEIEQGNFPSRSERWCRAWCHRIRKSILPITRSI